MSGLPLKSVSKRSDQDVRLFFDKYYTKEISLTDNDLNSVVGFFESKGFDRASAIAVATVLLKQSKLDGVKVYQVIDTLKKYEDLQLSAIVAEILNYNRKRTSAIGFKRREQVNKVESRNIIEGSPTVVTINTDVENNFSATGFTFDSDTITWDGE